MSLYDCTFRSLAGTRVADLHPAVIHYVEAVASRSIPNQSSLVKPTCNWPKSNMSMLSSPSLSKRF